MYSLCKYSEYFGTQNSANTRARVHACTHKRTRTHARLCLWGIVIGMIWMGWLELLPSNCLWCGACAWRRHVDAADWGQVIEIMTALNSLNRISQFLSITSYLCLIDSFLLNDGNLIEISKELINTLRPSWKGKLRTSQWSKCLVLVKGNMIPSMFYVSLSHRWQYKAYRSPSLLDCISFFFFNGFQWSLKSLFNQTVTLIQ